MKLPTGITSLFPRIAEKRSFDVTASKGDSFKITGARNRADQNCQTMQSNGHSEILNNARQIASSTSFAFEHASHSASNHQANPLADNKEPIERIMFAFASYSSHFFQSNDATSTQKQIKTDQSQLGDFTDNNETLEAYQNSFEDINTSSAQPTYEVPDSASAEPIYEVPDSGNAEPIYDEPDSGNAEPIYEVPDSASAEPIYEVPGSGNAEPIYDEPDSGYEVSEYNLLPELKAILTQEGAFASDSSAKNNKFITSSLQELLTNYDNHIYEEIKEEPSIVTELRDLVSNFEERRNLNFAQSQEARDNNKEPSIVTELKALVKSLEKKPTPPPLPPPLADTMTTDQMINEGLMKSSSVKSNPQDNETDSATKQSISLGKNTNGNNESDA